MSHGYLEATTKEIDEVVAKLCDLYPNIPESDHRMIADIAYDNYFGKEEMFRWYKSTASKLTSKVLEGIRADPHPFFYSESHLVGEGCTALADRKDI